MSRKTLGACCSGSQEELDESRRITVCGAVGEAGGRELGVVVLPHDRHGAVGAPIDAFDVTGDPPKLMMSPTRISLAGTGQRPPVGGVAGGSEVSSPTARCTVVVGDPSSSSPTKGSIP